MEEMEYNIQKYELNQHDKEYILLSGLVNDKLRLTCYENLEVNDIYYMNEFALEELSSYHKYFLLSESIEAAQSEINKAVERQKCGLIEEENLIKIIFYLTVGTDLINLTLPLNKQNGPYRGNKPLEEEPKYISALNLKNKGNYPKDEKRIVNLENYNSNFKNEQHDLHQQFENLIQESMQLINEAYALKEDNAKLRERINIIKKDNGLRKGNIIELKKEDKRLKMENYNLKMETDRLEKMLKNRNDTNIKELEENKRKTQALQYVDSTIGPVAKSMKFEKPEIQTFVPRPTMRPMGQTYQDKNDIKNRMKNSPF